MKRLAGSTLLEVLSSLALLALLFMLGSVLFQQLGGIHSPLQTLRTRRIMGNFLTEPISLPLTRSEIRELSGRTCERTVEVLIPQKGVVRLTVSCAFGEELLDTRSIIMRIPQE